MRIFLEDRNVFFFNSQSFFIDLYMYLIFELIKYLNNIVEDLL